MEACCVQDGASNENRPWAGPCTHACLPWACCSGLETGHLGARAGAEPTCGSFDRPVSTSPSPGPFTPSRRSWSTSPAQGRSRPRACRACRCLGPRLSIRASRLEGPKGDRAGGQDHPSSRAAERLALHVTLGRSVFHGWGLGVSGQAAPSRAQPRSGSPLALASIPPLYFGSNDYAVDSASQNLRPVCDSACHRQQ